MNGESKRKPPNKGGTAKGWTSVKKKWDVHDTHPWGQQETCPPGRETGKTAIYLENLNQELLLT